MFEYKDKKKDLKKIKNEKEHGNGGAYFAGQIQQPPFETIMS